MSGTEFDVDSSIAAGWSGFVDSLAELLRAHRPGDVTDIVVPVGDEPPAQPHFLRFTVGDDAMLRGEIPAPTVRDPRDALRPDQLATLGRAGWAPDGPAGDLVLVVPRDDARRLAQATADALHLAFGVPHPVFLNDSSAAGLPGRDLREEPIPDDRDFQPTLVDCPDTATRAIGTALAEVFRCDMAADTNDVFAVPAGSALVLVRAHRSLPLVIFRSPLVSEIGDVEAARREVAELNRDSLWCRYVLDGNTIYAESELVDRVFVPVNFKIRLAEIVHELDDVDDSLAARVSGKRWIDLHGGPGPGR